MIEVKQHGTNYFTLKGLCLSERTFSESTIAISGSGFRIELRFEPNGFLHAEMLRRRQVVPKLKAMLKEYRTDEDVNESEINRYLVVLEKFANDHPDQFPKVESGQRWAICQFYEPFVMGGNVWQWRRFAVEAEDVELVEDFIGFVF